MDLAVAYPSFAEWMWSPSVNKQLDFKTMAESGDFPVSSDLLVSVWVALFFTVLYAGSDMVIVRPFANWILGVKNPPLDDVPPEFEAMYLKLKPKLPQVQQMKDLADASKMAIPDVNNWFKNRQSRDRNVIKVKRFSESLWRLSLYTIAFSMDVFLVLGQPWSENTRLCWRDLQTHTLDDNMRFFYLYVQLPLYIHLFMYQVWETRLVGGQWEMTLHHALVISLMVFAYLGNFLRIGCLMLVYHDVTDLFIESSRLLKYLRWNGLSDLVFACFATSWVVARLYLVSVVVLKSTFVESVEEDIVGDSYYYFNGLICVLVALNLYWFTVIAKVAYAILWAGPQAMARRDGTDISTDDDSDSSYLSEMSDAGVKYHED